MRFARRAPASPPSAKEIARRSMVSLSVVRAPELYDPRQALGEDAAHTGEGVLQKNLRTQRMSLTR
jgi:hypothetical protein